MPKLANVCVLVQFFFFFRFGWNSVLCICEKNLQICAQNIHGHSIWVARIERYRQWTTHRMNIYFFAQTHTRTLYSKWSCTVKCVLLSAHRKMYRHKRPQLTFLRLDRSIIFGSYLFFYRRTSDLLSCYCCLDHQKTRYKKYHSFYASFFALSLWLCLLFGLCACLYVCAVQISNVCIHYNIILFFSALFALHLCLSMMRSVLVYSFFSLYFICVHSEWIQMVFDKHLHKCINTDISVASIV